LGGGGGGGGGLGGGGAGGGGAGYNAVQGGQLVAVDPGLAQDWAAVHGVWSKLTREWIAFTLGQDGVQAAYSALFRLRILLVEGRSWEGVVRDFGVDEGPGCLVRLVDRLVDIEGRAPHEKLKAPLKAALLDFAQRLVGDDPVVLDAGDARQVMAALDPQVFELTSNQFLSAYIHENLRIEGKNLSRTARAHFLDYATAKANQVVAAFDRKYRGKPWGDIPQASFPHMMRILAKDADWAVKNLRAKVNP
jgi:hypothetical protein